MSIVKLQIGDGTVVEVDREVALMFAALEDIIENWGLEEDQEPIIIDYLNSEILEKVIEWCTHHKGDPLLEEYIDGKTMENISEWDKEFLKVEESTLLAILQAAWFLEVNGLMHVIGKHFALEIRGKTTEEIRERFHIVDDFTPEEKEEIREKEDAWRLLVSGDRL